MQARVLDEVAVNNLAGHDLMADMFREDDQQDWQHHHDRAAVEHRRVEVRQHKERGSSNRLGNR